MSQSNAAVDFEFQYPAKPAQLNIDEKAQYIAKIKSLLIEKNAVLVAHYYTDQEIQALAEWRVLAINILHKHLSWQVLSLWVKQLKF